MSDNGQRITRKELLKAAAQSVVLIGLGGVGLKTLKDVRAAITKRKDEVRTPGKPWYSMAIDIDKCIGCGLCVVACSKENNVPVDKYRTWVEKYVIKKDGSVDISSPKGGKNGFADDPEDEDAVRSFFVPKICNHCDDSPCIQSCPVGATFRSENGIILIDYDWCIGCGYCIQACPYGSRFWNDEKKTADKCTFCHHRLAKGLQPACVEVCPTGARIFGDLNDEESPLSIFIRDNPTMILKPELTTGAKVEYKGLSKEVV